MRKSLPQLECSRRSLLQTLGAAALGGILLAGCGSNGADLPSATSTTCGANTCIDLGDSANAALTQVGGTMVIDTANDTIIVVRVSATSVVALSAICTHAGCLVDFNESAQRIDCPCHGSEFGLDGRVIHGPAGRALKMYTATLASDLITITA